MKLQKVEEALKAIRDGDIKMTWDMASHAERIHFSLYGL